MNKEQALVKYSNKYLKDYTDADDCIWINISDQDLHPVKLLLPPCPDWGKIDNFGLKAEDQYFQRETYPVKLKILEEEVSERIRGDKRYKNDIVRRRAFFDLIYKELTSQRKEYRDVIGWIKKQWAYRIYGKWIFIKGKPTHLVGWHWFYLNYWNLEEVGPPDYWDRDMKWFHAQDYAFRTTETPQHDQGGELIYTKDGSLLMIDIGQRTFFGANNLKGRRVGDTSKSQCIMYEVISSEIEARGGIQGDDDDTGRKVFKDKLILAFRKMPFFFVPRTNGEIDPATHLNFDLPYFKNSLNSFIDYATTSKRNYYDSKKLRVYEGTEVGKTLREDVHRRHAVVRRCCGSSGGKIHGFMMYDSTVDQIDLVSGRQFLELSKASHFEQRNENGMTSSGLMNVFFPAWEGAEGFIGAYGESIIENPTKSQTQHMDYVRRDKNGKPLGAKEYFENERKDLIDKGDIEGLAEHKRLHPFSFREAFTPPSKNTFFDMQIIEETLNYLDFVGDKDVRRGNYVWKTYLKEVEFMDDDEGRFVQSKELPKDKKNRMITINGVRWPEFPDTYIASADCFRLEKTDGGILSNGGGAVRWKHDPVLDPSEKDIGEYVSARLVVTYSYRPQTLDEYCDDMLKMCVYWGALMYPEMNIDAVAKYFIGLGFQGYLMYDVDSLTGKKRENPGWHMVGPNIKPKMFGLIADDIKKHGKRCKHADYLMECASIRNMDETTKFDLFTAVGGTLLAERSNYSEIINRINTTTVDVDGIWGSI